ncbi:hypothetical protein FB565_006639 [Actinoplanes lutulentus]|uniref:NACHT domain-containing protein n=1 Tax=Actinoplanes lutulentus TaxID=1287878 RepID=UPI0015ECB31F|nr:NACHT domain-containing protein [Actinoplanes lutulentus]MBB2946871.1 hypothetical protein [Actinoplanes lutulentus]
MRRLARGNHRNLIPFIVTAVVAIAVTLIWQSGLDTADRLASVGSFVLGAATLLAALRSRGSFTAVPLGEQAAALREAVREQWRAEERIRRVQDPAPIPVRWAVPEPAAGVQDHWANVRRAGGPGIAALDLAGRLDEITTVFRRVPSRRLVVLGEAGSGKSVLLIRLLLDLIETGQAEEPVPVLLSLTTWSPDRQSFPDWLAERLAAGYPALSAGHRGFGTAAAALVAGDRILPVLDGLDELPTAAQATALLALNAALPQPAGFVLAARTEPYRAAVSAGDVLTGAAVVRLQPLTATDLAAYLPLTARPAGAAPATRWDPVLRRLTAGPGDEPARLVAGVLSSPLMTSLARAAYSDTGADPAELFDFRSPGDLEEHLLDQAVPVAYSGDPRPAGEWLTWLAGHLPADIAWWRLTTALPRPLLGATGALIGAVTLAATAWFVGGGPLAAAGTGVLGGAATALVVLHQPMVPTGARLGIRRTRGLWIRGRTGAPTAGVLGWLAGGTALAVALWFTAGPLAALAGCGAIAAARALDVWLDVPADVGAAGPDELLRSDRRTALSRAVLRGGILGATAAALISVPAGLAVATAAAVTSVLFTAWGRFTIARCWLALRGHLPWRLMPFLSDAHRRGLLRQSGGTYQFRHARLRERLLSHQHAESS